MITKDNIDAGVFDLQSMQSEWYLDPNYKKLALLEGETIQVWYDLADESDRLVALGGVFNVNQ